MASTMDEIRALLAWNPPLLSVDKRRSKAPSTSSRAPAFYDKHFSTKLILKHVRRLPSLAQQLAGNVEKALQEASETLPPLDGFTTANFRHMERRSTLRTAVTDEKGVMAFYEKTSGKYCTPLASFLALHPKTPYPAWYSLVNFTQSPGSASEAVEDGRLHLATIVDDDPSIQADVELLVQSLESKTRRVFMCLQEADATLMTWEGKSLSVGSRKVMLSVLSLDEFKWTSCIDPDCQAIESHRRQRQKIQYAEKIFGCDAEDPPWKWEASLSL
jgi:hypothetical protein